VNKKKATKAPAETVKAAGAPISEKEKTEAVFDPSVSEPLRSGAVRRQYFRENDGTVTYVRVDAVDYANKEYASLQTFTDLIKGQLDQLVGDAQQRRVDGVAEVNARKQRKAAKRDPKILADYDSFMAAIKDNRARNTSLRGLLTQFKVERWTIETFKESNINQALRNRYPMSRTQMAAILKKRKVR
jgi:hypothetical protein